MSVSLMMAVRNDHDPRLTPSLKLTLITLASYHSEKSPERGTTPKTDRIAVDTGFSPRRIQEHLNELESIGKIAVDRPSPKRRGRLYVLASNASSRVSETRDLAVGNASSRGATNQVRDNKPRDIKPPSGDVATATGEPVDPRLENPDADVFDDTPRKSPKGGTNRCVTYFGNQIRRIHRLEYFSVGLMRREVAVLLNEKGMTPDEVMEYMDYWLLREFADIQRARSTASRNSLDLATWFRKGLNRSLLDVWQQERLQASTTNTAFGARSLNEKLGL